MKRFLLPVFALMLVLSVSFANYETAQAACSTNCYYASGVFLKNSNGTNFTGYADIYVSHGAYWRYGEHFTNGVNDSGYIWAGQVVGTWYGVGFHAYQSGVWKGGTVNQVRSSLPPFLPNVTIIQFF